MILHLIFRYGFKVFYNAYINEVYLSKHNMLNIASHIAMKIFNVKDHEN